MRHPSSLLVLVLTLTGCGGASAHGRLGSVELLTGGAQESDPLPLVVALPGRGGDPYRFQQAFHGFETPARVVVLQAPIPEGRGFAWFTFGLFADPPAAIRALVPRIASTVAALVAAHPPRGKPVVTGFSQGAMLIYPLVASHPSTFGTAIPVSGACWREVLPAHLDAARFPPIHALHGDADEVIPASTEVADVAALRARGVTADVEVVPGAHHWIGGALRERFQATLAAAIAAAQQH